MIKKALIIVPSGSRRVWNPPLRLRLLKEIIVLGINVAQTMLTAEKNRMGYALYLIIPAIICFGGCKNSAQQEDLVTITDQIGRVVRVPRHIQRISAMHHFGGKIVFALKQQDKLVDQAIYGRESKALAAVDPHFASLPNMLDGHSMNFEGIVALKPDVVFVYASNDRSEIDQFENAGIRVIGVKGETIAESFEAIKLMATVLNCPERGQEYLDDCRNLLRMVRERIAGIPSEKRLKAMFTGPKSIYAVATGQMIQTEILNNAGAVNVASELNGFWADVSPEQVALWNPDVIFLGSSLNTYDLDSISKDSHFQMVSAIKNKKVYVFPSNIGWWDYPAPHCVLGVVWSAKTLYPERFKDVDMIRIADEFYRKYIGYSFTFMGGKL